MSKKFKLSLCPVCFVLSAFIVSSCMKNDINNISNNVEINSSYSIPIGEVIYTINDYLKSLDTVTIFTPDSLMFNDTTLPNIIPGITFNDLKQFSFTQVNSQLNKIHSITFRIIISNGYPTNAFSQVYFLDAGNNKIDSLFATGRYYLRPATINADGVVTNPYAVMFDVPMSQNFINNLPTMTNILIENSIATKRADIPIVKFYDNYKVEVHIGARIELLFNTSSF